MDSLQSLQNSSARHNREKKQDLEQISHEMMGVKLGFVVEESEQDISERCGRNRGRRD